MRSPERLNCDNAERPPCDKDGRITLKLNYGKIPNPKKGATASSQNSQSALNERRSGVGRNHPAVSKAKENPRTTQRPGASGHVYQPDWGTGGRGIVRLACSEYGERRKHLPPPPVHSPAALPAHPATPKEG
jgi:hypothetical protein